MTKHNNIWCDKYNDLVLPDEQNNCSLCGAELHDASNEDARNLVDHFAAVACEREEREWDARKYLTINEISAYDLAYELAFGGDIDKEKAK